MREISEIFCMRGETTFLFKMRESPAKSGRLDRSVQDNKYVLDDDDESEKEGGDKGNAENEEELEILIHSNLPIVIE